MKFKSSILVSFLLIVVCSAADAQDERRIIRADRPDSSEDSSPILQVLGLKIRERSVAINEIFVADENWLKDLKVTVRNVSDKDLRCVGVWLGVLDGLNAKLGPGASWGWKINYTNGCSKRLKKGESVDLIWYSDGHLVPDLEPWPTFHKAVLEWGYARYKGDRKDSDFHDIRLLLPSDTKFLDGDSY